MEAVEIFSPGGNQRKKKKGEKKMKKVTNHAYAEMMRVDSFSLIRRYTHICWYR